MRKIIVSLQTLGKDYLKESIDWIEKALSLNQETINQIIGNQSLLEALLHSCANWETSVQAYNKYKSLLSDIANN